MKKEFKELEQEAYKTYVAEQIKNVRKWTNKGYSELALLVANLNYSIYGLQYRIEKSDFTLSEKKEMKADLEAIIFNVIKAKRKEVEEN